MATIRITPTDIDVSSANISNSENAFTNVDSDTYASIKGRTSTYTNATIYLFGFDLTAVPADARVTGFDIKLKHEFVGTSGSYSLAAYRFKPTNTTPCISKYGGTKSGLVTTFDNIASDDSIITWSDIVNNEDMSTTTPAPSVYLYYSVNSNTSELRIYGAEIDVYTWEPDTHGIFNLILPRG